jgi:FixJ family two-component response regulator
MSRATKAAIAVIDDDFHVLESLDSLLVSAGYSVQAYQSAESFLNADGDSNIDCVISDIGMPALGGLDLQGQLLAKRPNLPVILITGRYDVSAPGVSAPNNRGFFRKPVDAFELLQAVGAALANRP